MTIALVDCNNFYVRCEQIFQPELEGKPVVSLSNNDGNVISRSAEAKALGIKMGQPWFELQDLVRKHGVIARSSNFALYADMSDRCMQVIDQFATTQEIYSIDESFLSFEGLPGCHSDRARDIRAAVWKNLRLVVAVGIGTTKTQAKLANHIAKTRPEFGGVFDLGSLPAGELDTMLAAIDVGEVWGVGRKIGEQLRALGINTVQQLRRAEPEFIRQQFSVVLERTVRELQGQPCIELETVAPPKQQIICSRSFGSAITDLAGLREAISMYTANAAERLRRQESCAGVVTVFCHTSPFGDGPKYSGNKTVALAVPTADTRQLVGHALQILDRIFAPGYRYKKAGVVLTNIIPGAGQQTDLFGNTGAGQDQKKSKQLMAAMDSINQKYGRASIRPGSQGFGDRGCMRQQSRSSDYTTNWDGLIRAR